MTSWKPALCGLLCGAVALSAQAQSPPVFSGFLTGRTAVVRGQSSWIEGGFGRLDLGAKDAHDSAWRGNAVAQLGADWAPSSWLNLHAQVLGRAEPGTSKGRRAGLVEAFAELHSETWQVRAGQFFLGTSRENIGPLWTSPYTSSFSALNSWIGQEVRPVGVDVQWKPNFYLSGGVTAFRGNDSMGALLAWRGWSVGNRLSTFNEAVPLPPLFSLRTSFRDQRADGTVPFERDLDGRTGFAARLRAQLPERALIQFTRIDNRGDREVVRGEYAWRTRFNIVSTQAGTSSPVTALAEYTWGSTGMGPRPVFVQADFYAAYLLVSWHEGSNRFSGRIDRFGTTDRDRVPSLETNTEHGTSWTVAWLHDLHPKLRLATEFTGITGDRIAAQQSGGDPNLDSHSLTLELRYAF